MTCKARYCGYPKDECDLDIEFAGSFDAEDFYYTSDMDRCQKLKEEEYD
jgi:hypothetical protein